MARRERDQQAAPPILTQSTAKVITLPMTSGCGHRGIACAQVILYDLFGAPVCVLRSLLRDFRMNHESRRQQAELAHELLLLLNWDRIQTEAQEKLLYGLSPNLCMLPDPVRSGIPACILGRQARQDPTHPARHARAGMHTLAFLGTFAAFAVSGDS